MTTLVLEPSSSINEALSNAPDGPVTLILKEGVWREKVFVNRPNVTLLSEEGARIDNDDRHGTVRDGKVFATGDSATFTVSAPNFTALGVTFSNSFDYPSGKKWNTEHKDDGKRIDLQAVAFRAAFGSDHMTLRACNFLGWQDTLYLDSGYTLLEDCTIKGNVDYIFGAGSALFQGCEIVSKGQGYVAAPSTFESEELGFVFHDCVFSKEGDTEKGSVFIARPWHPAGSENRNPMVLLIDCSLSPHINPYLWTDMKSKRPDGTEKVWKGENSRFSIFSSGKENIKVEEADRLLKLMMARL
ncbi:MAG: pectinesterase family protein [Candidatus Ornithospirochaeta sp.]